VIKVTNIYLIAATALLILFLRNRMVFSKDVKNVSSKEAYELIKSNKELVVIDVRTVQEYKSGHISGAKSIPVNEISSRTGELNSYKEKPVLVHCASGGRSGAAVRILVKAGFKNIYHMNHGLTSWNYGLKR
jgi:rhodanese-related sulfurtransferase